MEKINITIDGIKIQTEPNKTILQVAKDNGIIIPTLCYLKDVNEPASCRVCVVEVEGARGLMTSCNTMVRPDMVVRTSTPKVIESRKKTVELLLSNHNQDCLSCSKNTKCTLQKLSDTLHCDSHKYDGEKSKGEVDTSSMNIVRDMSKCVLCGKCVAVCAKRQGVSAITKIDRGFETKVGCAFNKPIWDSSCIGCGQCTLVCPTGALMLKSDIDLALEYLNDETYETAVQIAPSVRVGIAEEFGYPIGTFCEGQLASALRIIGFDHVYDVNNGADFTIVEESKELLERMANPSAPMPMFTSCCPAWYKYMEKNYPEMMPNISTCKSPNEMLGSLVKYYHEKNGGNKPLKVISIMPCTAKKHEIVRDNGDVDVVLTTRELSDLIKYKNIDFTKLPDGQFDKPFGMYSGAALIFGATGGVMEAAIRTAITKLNLDEPKDLNFEVVRNSTGRKEVELKTDKAVLRVAIVNGLANAKQLIEDIKAGSTKVDFVEVMACPGGCVNGGGQPLVDYSKIDLKEVIEKRTAPLYSTDKKLTLKQSHKNEELQNIYKSLLNNDDHLIHKLLHVEKYAKHNKD